MTMTTSSRLHASVGVTSNLDFAQWTEVFGHARMTAALLDRLVHRATILLLEGESYRFRQSLQQQIQGPTSVRRAAPTRQPEAGDQGHAMEAGEEGRTGDKNAERNVDGQVSVTLELQDAKVEQGRTIRRSARSWRCSASRPMSARTTSRCTAVPSRRGR
jgi:hypothetical protein